MLIGEDLLEFVILAILISSLDTNEVIDNY